MYASFPCNYIFVFSDKNPPITAFVNGTVRIPCGRAKTVATPVDWYYIQPSPNFVDDSTIVTGGQIISNTCFGHRLSIDGSTLIINKVRFLDRGHYMCREYITGGSSYREHHVTVAVKGKYCEQNVATYTRCY